MRFRDRTALVTGGGSGIGLATCRRLVAEGARVVVADRDGDAAAREAAALGDRARAVALDVSSATDVDAAVAATAGDGLDLVVTCAGIFVPDAADAAWERTLAVNLDGTRNVALAAWPYLEASGGCIVTLGSTAALQGFASYTAYCTSKAAVVMLTRCLALAGAAQGIRVACVCPGPIDTPMMDRFYDEQPDPAGARAHWAQAMPLGRTGTPDDVVEAILYLASDAASWVTGSALVVDGGLMSGLKA